MIEKIGYDYNIDIVKIGIPVDHLHNEDVIRAYVRNQIKYEKKENGPRQLELF